jgi:hypothetical protein
VPELVMDELANNGGNLAVVRFDCAISSGLFNFGGDIKVISRNRSGIQH